MTFGIVREAAYWQFTHVHTKEKSIDFGKPHQLSSIVDSLHQCKQSQQFVSKLRNLLTPTSTKIQRSPRSSSGLKNFEP